MTQAAEAIPDDDNFHDDPNLVDTTASGNEFEALGSGDEPEVDDVDRPEMVCFCYI